MIENEDTRSYIPPDVLMALAALRAGGQAGVLTVLPMKQAGRVAFMLGISTPARTDPDSVVFEWFAPLLTQHALEGWEPATVADLQAAGFTAHRTPETH